MALYIGIDIGSVFSKGVLINDKDVAATCVTRSGSNYSDTAEKIRQELLREAKILEDVVISTAATGSGAANVKYANQSVSDMHCTARGIHSIFPDAKMAVDIGTQATKVIRIDARGQAVNFAVSERCAAGGARFVDIVANVLRIDLDDFGELAMRSQNPVTFSTSCAVFGESEAVTRVAQGIPKEDIAAGVNQALAGKIASMIKKVGLEKPCVACGGGALNTGLLKTLEKQLQTGILVPPQPQIVTALGAAITAAHAAVTSDK